MTRYKFLKDGLTENPRNPKRQNDGKSPEILKDITFTGRGPNPNPNQWWNKELTLKCKF